MQAPFEPFTRTTEDLEYFQGYVNIIMTITLCDRQRMLRRALEWRFLLDIDQVTPRVLLVLFFLLLVQFRCPILDEKLPDAVFGRGRTM